MLEREVLVREMLERGQGGPGMSCNLLWPRR